MPNAYPLSTDQQVKDVLGPNGNRLPAWINVEAFRRMAGAEVVDQLANVYPNGLPTFAGAGLDAVTYAEAKLAAASILEAIRVNLPDLGDAPDRLRTSATLTLSGGVVGYPPGSETVDTGGGVPQSAAKGPRVSSFTPASAFPDPYAALRDAGVRYL